MNLLDIAIIAVMIFLVIRGIMRGFFREIASLAGVVCGIWLGIVYQPQAQAYLEPYLGTVSFLPLLAFGVIFTVVLFACNVAAWVLKGFFKVLLNRIFFGWFDRALGAGLAVLKGVILTYLVIVVITFTAPSQAPLIAQSKLAPVIISSYQKVTEMIPPDTYDRWKSRLLNDPPEMPSLDEPFLEDPLEGPWPEVPEEMPWPEATGSRI